jgi:hypothetical protein
VRVRLPPRAPLFSSGEGLPYRQSDKLFFKAASAAEATSLRCPLYNQETDEHPQLYFDHLLKVGNAYDLARELRRGLDLTKAK